MILEICCGDVESVDAAFKGGADRIELCSALPVGGVTPSPGLISQAIWKSERRMEPVPVNVLIRPRSGDFLYTDHELACIVEDVAAAVGAGCAGIVFGALNSDGTVDEYACGKVIETVEKAAEGRKVSLTFHRAFDVCRDPFEALETVIKLGFDRILTSGLAPTAEEGVELLRKLVEKADGRISIMPGAGVTEANIAAIVKKTGVTEIHASAKFRRKSKMKYLSVGVEMSAGSDELYWPETSEHNVRELKNNLIPCER